MVTAPDWARRVPVALPRRGTIPIADSVALRGPLQRTTAVRLSLAVLLLLLTAFAVWRAAALNPRPVPFLDRRTTTRIGKQCSAPRK